MKDLAICIPTFNEVANITPLLTELCDRYPDSLLVVIDDGSTDGTRQAVEKLASTRANITLLRRSKKDGLGKAYCAGMMFAMAKGYRAICQMDGDLSHQPHYIAQLYKALDQADFVVGSRYVVGGGCSGWSIGRTVLSRLGNIYARLFITPSLHDMTGGFNIWHRKVLETLELPSLSAKGYAFQVELKARALYAGFVGVEIPITFYERAANRSKMTLKIAVEALLRIPLLARSRNRLTLVPSTK